MHGPTQLFTVIALVSLPTVMYGGYALMGVLRDRKLTEHQRAMFRAGHAHAGVLLVLALVALQILSRTTLSGPALWIACFLLLFGILAQSGGFFLHLLPNQGKLGGRVTSVGAVLLAAAVLLTAYGVAFP
ncbi:hypothetical protein [Amycolatopsis vancoresmycina]|uniref:Integral membrane protein n=1 Tax=Amycolatopsis vancoresmycina DSM 44592 TaxID=1292037 RepID=R1IFS2_9PSEU|nr:hypothetical protein [Amycolatopsis vancoresmycina]EOD69259.1 hypothetical protein H480_06638 [Amycolatopsis vancoresmycina DSM 44592]